MHEGLLNIRSDYTRVYGQELKELEHNRELLKIFIKYDLLIRQVLK